MGLTPDGIFQVLENAPFGAYAVSIDRTILFWNQGAQRIAGYSSSQVVGYPCYEGTGGSAPGGPVPQCREVCPSVEQVRRGLVPSEVPIQFLCASGEYKLVRATPVVVPGVGNDPPILVYLFGDESDPQGSYVPSTLVADALASATPEADLDDGDGETAPQMPGLTARELEVLGLVSRGWDTPRIGEELGISPHTVLNHIRHFRRKLSANTKLDAVVTAIRLGILPIN